MEKNVKTSFVGLLCVFVFCRTRSSLNVRASIMLMFIVRLKQPRNIVCCSFQDKSISISSNIFSFAEVFDEIEMDLSRSLRTRSTGASSASYVEEGIDVTEVTVVTEENQDNASGGLTRRPIFVGYKLKKYIYSRLVKKSNKTHDSLLEQKQRIYSRLVKKNNKTHDSLLEQKQRIYSRLVKKNNKTHDSLLEQKQLMSCFKQEFKRHLHDGLSNDIYDVAVIQQR